MEFLVTLSLKNMAHDNASFLNCQESLTLRIETCSCDFDNFA